MISRSGWRLAGDHFILSGFNIRIRKVGEADPHRCVVPGVVDAAKIYDAPAIPGAELVNGRVEAFLFFVTAGHGVGNHGLEKLGGVVPSFAKAGENNADLEDG